MNAPQKRDLNELVFLLKVAKLNEEQAKKERLVLETLILGELPVKSEGTVSKKTENGTVSVTYSMTRKVDDISLVAAWDSLVRPARKVFKWKPEVKVSELKKIQELLPVVYADVAKFITATPSKPTVSIK
jgi:hypothetical protein